MKTRRVIFLGVVLIIIGGYFVYNYMYKDHRDIQSETSKFEISATYLLERFKTEDGDELLNSTMTVSGVVSAIEEGAITLDGSVYCSLSEPIAGLKLDDQVAVKGRCIGYDDLFEIVKLDQCTLIK